MSFQTHTKAIRQSEISKKRVVSEVLMRLLHSMTCVVFLAGCKNWQGQWVYDAVRHRIV